MRSNICPSTEGGRTEKREERSDNEALTLKEPAECVRSALSKEASGRCAKSDRYFLFSLSRNKQTCAFPVDVWPRHFRVRDGAGIAPLRTTQLSSASLCNAPSLTAEIAASIARKKARRVAYVVGASVFLVPLAVREEMAQPSRENAAPQG